MALLRRYGLYTAIAAFFLYMLYSLSFPYDSDGLYSDGEEGSQKTPGGKSGASDGDDDNGYGQSANDKGKHGSNGEPIQWDKVALKNPIESFIPLPSGAPKPLSRIQASFPDEDETARNIRDKRRNEVKKTFLRCWKNYRQNAWLHDELRPITGGAKDTFGGWAATLIDALDTLWIMGFKEEFQSALRDVELIDFGRTHLDTINVFETNIRHLGGLLAAYELSKEKVLLRKAIEVGEMLYHAFDTPNHMPITRWDLHKAGNGQPQVADETVLVAEIGSMTMEFSRLSQLTGDPKWYDAITRVTRVFEQQQDRTALPGMWPIVVNARKPDFTVDTGFTLGAMADSTYEYFAKTYALLGGLDPVYKKLYEGSTSTAIKHTMFRPMLPDNADILASGFVRAEGSTVTLNPELQHLGCFTGGMFALGGKIFGLEEHVAIGRKLTDTCVWAYKASPAGIMPEVSHLYRCPSLTDCAWDSAAWQTEVQNRADVSKEKDPQQNIANLRLPEGFTAIDDRRYILRPEAIESVFVLYRITGMQHWQAAAWDMWTAIEKATATEFGNAALLDISDPNPPKMDSMESFWPAETLKYFYLIFSDPKVISLDDWVFNTEAHPLRIPKPT